MNVPFIIVSFIMTILLLLLVIGELGIMVYLNNLKP